VTSPAEGSPRIGLVLGAGGTVGCAYHAGVLAGLQHHTGWDARDAVSIVGTSAGSLVGALLRVGLGPDDLVALLGQDDAAVRPGHLEALRSSPDGTIPRQWIGALRPPTPGSVYRSLLRRSIMPAILSMTRRTGLDLLTLVAELDDLCPTPWPHRDLRICTVDVASGRRRVLDRDSGVGLAIAVAASCAVPGVFASQLVGARHLVDGGLHSVTNVDALPFGELDEVWVVAPMAGAMFQHLDTRRVRNRIRAALRHELRSVPDGMPVRVFQPQAATASAMGVNLMARDRSLRTARAAFAETATLAAVA
jgi:NTE family protein